MLGSFLADTLKTFVGLLRDVAGPLGRVLVPPLAGAVAALFVVFWVALAWRVLEWLVADLPPPTVAPLAWVAAVVAGSISILGWAAPAVERGPR